MHFLDKRPCTCGGENPNCFKCDGTGLLSIQPATLSPIRLDAQRLLEPNYLAARSKSNIRVKPKKLKPASGIISDRKRPRKAANAGPVPCPYCRVSAPSRLVLEVHIQRAHLVHSKDKAQITKNRKEDQESQFLDRLRIDGALDWHAAYRDQGQFGSHPTFDPMDDESEP